MGNDSALKPGQFHYWKNPAPADIGDTCMEFLHSLPGPTHIHLTGKQSGHCRAVTTLMHGNEPSGLHGVFELLKQQIQPLVDIELFIASVDAAKQEPGFIYRMLPHNKDLNRCFGIPDSARHPLTEAQAKAASVQNPLDAPPLTDESTEQDLLAAELLRLLRELHPECCIDIHNTSGNSPSFGVVTFNDARHDALVSLFTHRMVVTDIRLGALMEHSSDAMPVVTIECGGGTELESHERALTGLKRFCTEADVLSGNGSDMALDFFHHPLRMELAEGSDIAFGSHALLTDGVTLLTDVEQFNFDHVTPDNQLGFVSGPLHANLTVKDPVNGKERIDEFFHLRNDALYPRQRLKLFMVTTNPEIARKDCLFYLTDPLGEENL
ncbi:MAG: hypothetical protein ACR2PR_00510 [Pseudohongiellaceae bacterium]